MNNFTIQCTPDFRLTLQLAASRMITKDDFGTCSNYDRQPTPFQWTGRVRMSFSNRTTYWHEHLARSVVHWLNGTDTWSGRSTSRI